MAPRGSGSLTPRLQAALSQAERLAQMATELEALRAQNASLHQQLEVKIKRIAQLEAALEEAQVVFAVGDRCVLPQLRLKCPLEGS